MSAASILLLGLLLGMQHATEADHLAAVATLATRERTLAQTVRQGLAWGIGHAFALAGFGGAALLLGRAIPRGLEQGLEAAVGAMLVLLGLDALRRWLGERGRGPVQRRSARGAAPAPGAAGPARATCERAVALHVQAAHRHAAGPGRWPLRALAVGTVHGLAGSAALVVLSLQSVPTLGLGFGYIALFGLGSIAGMALLSAAVAVPLRLGADTLGGVHAGMSGLVGLASCALGLAMLGARLAG